MNEKEFASLSLDKKWRHLELTMGYIMQMDSHYGSLNPHRSDSQKKQERRSLRLDQAQRWSHVKALYSAHRDELIDTLGNPDFENAKNIMERVFTQEVDDALRNLLGEES